jgi:hypothetical protein
MKAKNRFWRMLAIVASRQPPRADDAIEIALEQRDAGAFDGDIGARAHGDADIRCREGGRIVHPIARHRHDPAFAPCSRWTTALF